MIQVDAQEGDFMLGLLKAKRDLSFTLGLTFCLMSKQMLIMFFFAFEELYVCDDFGYMFELL